MSTKPVIVGEEIVRSADTTITAPRPIRAVRFLVDDHEAADTAANNTSNGGAEEPQIKSEPENGIPALPLPGPALQLGSSFHRPPAPYPRDVESDNDAQDGDILMSDTPADADFDFADDSTEYDSEDAEMYSLFGSPVSTPVTSPSLQPQVHPSSDQQTQQGQHQHQHQHREQQPRVQSPVLPPTDTDGLTSRELSMLDAAIAAYPDLPWGRDSQVEVDEQTSEVTTAPTTEVTDHAVVETSFQVLMVVRRTRKTRFDRQHRRQWINCRFRNASGETQYYRRGQRVRPTPENPTPWIRRSS